MLPPQCAVEGYITINLARRLAMKSDTIYSFFYDNIVKEALTLLQEEDHENFIGSCKAIARTDTRDFPETVRELYLCYKSLEKAIIAQDCFALPDNRYRSCDDPHLPRLFTSLYRKFVSSDSRVRPETGFCLSNSDRSRDPNVTSNFALYFQILRQCSLAFSKARDIPAQANEEEQVEQFIRRMKSTYDSNTSPLTSYLRSQVLAVARSLLRAFFCDDLGRVSPMFDQWVSNPFGRHGSGAVADGSKACGKWAANLNPRVKDLFAWSKGYLPLCRWDEELPPSRLCLVPKDPIKNRIICVEPKELMFAQQGLRTIVEALIKQSPLTRSVIRLDDQRFNFFLSKRRSHATIDLSDASDMLSLSVMRIILPREIFSLITRFRSSRIELPDGQVLESYNAFATMGNALCFPMESLAFWALTLAGILCEELRLGTYTSISEIHWIIYNNPMFLIRRFKLGIFGDDIIVPCRYFDAVSRALESVGLTVNKGKSCNDTPLRESCGSYWWFDYDVRYVHMSYALELTSLACASLIDQIKGFVDSGYISTANALASFCSTIMPSSVSFCGPQTQKGMQEGWLRWNARYQRLERRVLRVVRSRVASSRLPIENWLYAHFTSGNKQPLIPGDAQCVKWIWEPLDFEV